MADSSNPVIIYVCDESRAHHLSISIASLRRFTALPICVVDIGLSASTRVCVQLVAEERVTFCPPMASPPILDHVVGKQRANAFVQKTLIGSIAIGDPLIYLDSDILVVHPGFLDKLIEVQEGELLATPSAWDADFTWTYSTDSLSWLRQATGKADLSLEYPICNSGVWAMRRSAASAMSPCWHTSFRMALDSPQLWATLRPGTGIGDQEFLIPACRANGIVWTQLHGSFNMQVHENRMPWLDIDSGHPLGGHSYEYPQPVMAIHYGCGIDGTVTLDEHLIASPILRQWIVEQYYTCWRLVQQKLRN